MYPCCYIFKEKKVPVGVHSRIIQSFQDKHNFCLQRALELKQVEENLKKQQIEYEIKLKSLEFRVNVHEVNSN